MLSLLKSNLNRIESCSGATFSGFPIKLKSNLNRIESCPRILFLNFPQWLKSNLNRIESLQTMKHTHIRIAG